jgi:hypothetical protein
MQSRQTLIDKASAVCGSDAELARRLQVGRSMVANMRAGTSHMSPAMAGELAMIAGIDPLRAIQAVMMEDLGKTPRGQKVKDAIEAGFLAFVVAICCFFAPDASARGSSDVQLSMNTLHIVSSWWARMWQRIAAAIVTMGRCPIPRIPVYQ